MRAALAAGCTLLDYEEAGISFPAVYPFVVDLERPTTWAAVAAATPACRERGGGLWAVWITDSFPARDPFALCVPGKCDPDTPVRVSTRLNNIE